MGWILLTLPILAGNGETLQEMTDPSQELQVQTSGGLIDVFEKLAG
jgi:hypothetical protein